MYIVEMVESAYISIKYGIFSAQSISSKLKASLPRSNGAFVRKRAKKVSLKPLKTN